MVKKDQKWEWMERQEKAFRELKERFKKKPSIIVPDLDKKMRMEVDMPDYTIRGVLFMECKDRKWRLAAFLSKSLNEIERNYEIHNKEMLVVIRGLENWRHLLEGVTNFIQLVSPQPVDLFSQTKLHWKAPNEGYLHIYGIYKSNNKQPRY